MAPTRKSRSVNKRLSSLNEVSPEKDGAKSNKNKQKKKKLSDKLGSPWRKEELERFYEAYRKHGNDWKKVATFIRNRTIEMVEALYNMNRAYLSLPEGTASVVGLIAMMTDHYNVLEGSGSEQESNDESGTRRSLKGKRGRAQLSFSKDLVQSQSIASSDGCLSLLKRRRFDGSQPRAVGKRTPRFPVSYSYKRDDRQNYVSPYKRGRKSEINANDDVVAHVAALALTEASQRGGSPPVSQTAYRRAEHLKSSPVRSWERMKQHSETAGAKINDASIDEDWLEGSTESRGAENGEYGKDTSSLMDMEGVGTVEVHQRGKKFYRKKEKVENDGNHQLDDGGEACSGTEEGLHSSALREKVDIEVNDAKSEQFFLQGQRKRSKKLFFGDESSALDALQTLADLSIIMMPSSMMESESSVQLKEERRNADNKCGLPEATSASQCRGKVKLPSTKQKGLHAVSGVESATSRKSKLGRESAIDDNAVSEAKEQLQYTDKMWKRKRKPSASKIENAKLDSLPSKMLNNEAIAAEENKSAIRAKRSGQSHTHSKQLKSIRSTESSLTSDQKDSILPTAQVPLVNVVSLPATRSRRKMNLQRAFSPREMKSPENRMKNQPNKYYTSYQNRAFYLKEKLSGCLSSYMVRKWCTFEWFYSAIDYPWFAKREFMEYLNHVGLGNIPRLTRVEWSVIKSSLGKPRRFSEHFLHEERQKLEQYRESVRKHYTELRTGIRDGLPTDLAKPLFVGQRVIAIHPKTREVHDGSVLTVDHEKCRVQFARPDIGVEFVKDIDCMPLNPSDNMPEALRRQNAPCKVSFIFKEPQNRHPKSGSCMTSSLSGHLEKAHSPLNALVKQEKGDANCIISQAKAATIDTLCAEQAAYNQPCTVAHNQAREADIQPLTELTRALDKKEALVLELKNTNNEILESQNDMDYLKDSESFKKHYATVLVQLKEASGQVSSALHHLRQRNTYTGNSLLPWLKPLVNFSVHDGCPNSCDSSNPQELGSSVTEVIKGSRLRAHTMVGAAIQAFSSRKEGEDAFMRIGQVLDSIDNQQVASNSRLHVIRSQEQVNGSFAHQNQPISCASEPLLSSDVSAVKLCNVSDKNDIQMPSDLITSCVATMLMIQTCTKRQYPPADVAKILDSAVTSLHPCSPQNLPIYREIQMCMGRIKTQILALIPT